MKTEPIVPADIAFAPGEPPRAPAFDDVYHPIAGALEQARHVFLAGNGLPDRWRQRRHFVILETGFGLGQNFLAAWQAWRDDPQRCARLVFVSIDKHPPTREQLFQAHDHSPLPALAQALIEAWPPLTPNVHVIDLDGGAVRLLLALGDVEALLPQLSLQADAVFLDGFAPDRNPAMWSPRVLATVARKAAPGATLATWSVARAVRDGLRTGGFVVDRVPGFGGKREQSAARFAPAFVPRRSPGRMAVHAEPAAPTADRRVLVIGAGIAGAAAADALTRLGWSCTVIERHAAAAREASGNPGGLFHGTAHADDGLHARFNRAAALLAARRYRALIAAGRVPGSATGLLRLFPDDAGPPPLPADYVEALDRDAAAARAGLPLPGGAWRYAGGGWISPAALCGTLLLQPGIRRLMGEPVARLRWTEGIWTAESSDEHHVLAQAPAVVLATGAARGALTVIGTGLPQDLPLQAVRGQVTWFDSAGPAPMQPLAGNGYALRLDDGRLLCGATTEAGDTDTAVREADHMHNLARLQALCGLQAPAGAELRGRVGWRAVAPDRLPYVGAVPLSVETLPAGVRADQARFVPRVPGLFMLGGLASRGLTWAPLAAEILAAWMDGLPMPVEADLLDAVDPARVTARGWRRQGAVSATESMSR